MQPRSCPITGKQFIEVNLTRASDKSPRVIRALLQQTRLICCDVRMHRRAGFADRLLQTTHHCDVSEKEPAAPFDNGVTSGIVRARREVHQHMSSKVKGMVHLAGITYRIVRVKLGSYSVVRISDDLDVGSFHLAPELGIEARSVEPELLREVARLAIHTAKTSYVGFARPELHASDAANAVRHSPSSMPPAVPPT